MNAPTSTSRMLLPTLMSAVVVYGATGCALGNEDPWLANIEDDGLPPCVVATYPESGQRDWDRDGSVWFTFSEPMDVLPGEVVGAYGPDSTPIVFEAGWANGERTQLVATPQTPLPPRVAVAVAALGFRDARGNLQTTPHETRYETIDDVGPHLVSSFPAENALVDLPLDTIVLAFDESLNLTPAEATIGGLAAEITRFHWNDGQTEVHLSVANLIREETYRVRLDGVVDRAGNAGPPVVLDFEIDRDRTSPQVVDAFPFEGDVVAPGEHATVRVRLDEPMRAVDNRAVVEVDGVPYPAWGTLTEGQTVFELPLPDAAQTPGAHVAVRLNGLADRAGNRLDPTPIVQDGRLDYTVAAD